MANILNLVAEQGSTFKRTFDLTYLGNPLDVSTWGAELMIRKTYGSATPIITASLANFKLSKSVTIGEENLIILTLAPTDTSTVTFSGDDEELECVYDLELTDILGEQGVVGGVYKGARGTFSILREVTR